MTVERTLMYILSLSILRQLLFSFDRDMKVEKTLTQTFAGQFSPTLVELLFSFDRDMRVEKTLYISRLSTLIQLLFLFDWGMSVNKIFKRTLIRQVLL